MTLAQLRYAITVANSNSMNEAARKSFYITAQFVLSNP